MFRIQLIIALLFLLPMSAQSSDWQFAGNTMSGKVEEAMFYDAASVEHPSPSATRVWVKTVSQKALNNYTKKHVSDNQHIDAVASKIALGYIPRFFQLQTIKNQDFKPSSNGMTKQDLIIDVTGEEIIVNGGQVSATSKIYFEIDCPGKRNAILSSIHYRADGSVSQSGDIESPKFQHIAPDSTGEWVSLMLCPDH